MNILVVEDDRVFAIQLVQLLLKEGFIVDCCDSFEGAMARARVRDFDLAVVDLMLPPTFSEEGIRVLHQLRIRSPRIRCLMATVKAEHTTEVVARAMEAGAEFFFDKNGHDFVGRLISRIKDIANSMNDAIFISHGHDQRLLLLLQRFIETKLNRRTLVLSELPGRGRTIVEKLEDASDECNSAIVIITKDDEMRDGGKRGRQNVIHEIGFFQGKYGRKNVILLAEEGVELFTNISGIVRINFDAEHFEEVFEEIRNDLE
jgi:predicted nucleotide-binding protein